MSVFQSKPAVRTVLAGAIALFAVGFLMARVAGTAPGKAPAYHLSADQGHPNELVAVFLLSSDCFASRDKEMPRLLEEIKLSLQQSSGMRSHEFRAVAVAVDASPEAGWNLIRTMGHFDEVVLGGGWLNHGMLAYVWTEHAGPPDIPQVVLVRRGVQRMRDGIYGVSGSEVVGRFVGLGEIRRWALAGAPLRHSLGTDPGHTESN